MLRNEAGHGGRVEAFSDGHYAQGYGKLCHRSGKRDDGESDDHQPVPNHKNALFGEAVCERFDEKALDDDRNNSDEEELNADLFCGEVEEFGGE